MGSEQRIPSMKQRFLNKFICCLASPTVTDSLFDKEGKHTYWCNDKDHRRSAAESVESFGSAEFAASW